MAMETCVMYKTSSVHSRSKMQMRIVTIALSDGVIGQTWHFLDLIMINPKDQWTPFPKNNLTFTKSLFDKEQEVFYLQYNIVW